MTSVPGVAEVSGALSPNVRSGVAVGTLLLVLVMLFAVDNLLLLAFLGRSSGLLLPASFGATLALVWLLRRTMPAAGWRQRIGWPTVAGALAFAATLCLLGGQGRFLYANADWQIRDTVLADMGGGVWPFVYALPGGETLLRAPIGLYLRPALFGVGGQRALDLAMLVNTTVMMATLLALAAALFSTRRARVIAATLFCTVGGLDILGTALMHAAEGGADFDHLELWLWKLQYSATPTLAFWTPQHAIAGWAVALVVLLHRERLISLAAVVAIVPLVTLWSPFAVMGALPILSWIGGRALMTRRVALSDVAAGAVATVIALPALAYLHSGSAQVLFGWTEVSGRALILFIVLEVIPVLWLVRRLSGSSRWGHDLLVIATLMMLLLPLGRLGTGIDFVARVSIVPLTLLIAAIAAGAVVDDRKGRRDIVAIVLVAIGAVTGAAEVYRALAYRPAPPPQCSLPTAWDQQSGPDASLATYTAPVETLPAWLRPDAARIIDPARDPQRCWDRAWMVRR